MLSRALALPCAEPGVDSCAAPGVSVYHGRFKADVNDGFGR